jgi:hypothetical protein
MLSYFDLSSNIEHNDAAATALNGMRPYNAATTLLHTAIGLPLIAANILHAATRCAMYGNGMYSNGCVWAAA